MRIAVIGFGKMGHEVEAVAREHGEAVARTFNSQRRVTPDALADVDMCIEFSTPESALLNIRAAVEARKDIVVGSTGWYDHVPQLRRTVTESGILYSPNFSLGMNIFFRIVSRAAELIQNAPEYDAFVHEMHHRQKADSPSGTALRLAELLLQKIERKQRILAQPATGRIESDMLHVASTRAGFLTGTHTVGFDSESDLIELRHIAKNRKGFALGALVAARWLRGRKGVYTMDDVEL
jgi:4-hydroxy-tetrahydrodipicolinate reductase